MLMSHNKGETVVHDCHFPDDMIVRMRTILAVPEDRTCALISAVISVVYKFLDTQVTNDLISIHIPWENCLQFSTATICLTWS